MHLRFLLKHAMGALSALFILASFSRLSAPVTPAVRRIIGSHILPPPLLLDVAGFFAFHASFAISTLELLILYFLTMISTRIHRQCYAIFGWLTLLCYHLRPRRLRQCHLTRF
jgi:hypothetical protein